MDQSSELDNFTRNQLDAALMKIGRDAGMGTADGIRAFLAGEIVVSKPVCRLCEQDEKDTASKPQKDSVSGPGLLGANRCVGEGGWLTKCCGLPQR